MNDLEKDGAKWRMIGLMNAEPRDLRRLYIAHYIKEKLK